MPLSRPVLPLVALLCGGLLLAPDHGAASGQMARPVIAVSCPEPADAAMCRALVQALAAAAPGRVIRPDPVPAPPARDGDLALVLRIGSRGAHHIEGHLEWQRAGAAAETGPPLRLDVQDATLSDAMYPHFMRDLVRLSGLPF